MRAESGNAISTENPSFDVGAAGGCGTAGPEPSPADFVCVPMGSLVMAGGSQAHRVAEEVLPDLIGCMFRSGIIASQIFYGIGHNMTRSGQAREAIAAAPWNASGTVARLRALGIPYPSC
jgi:hypothetical protein